MSLTSNIYKSSPFLKNMSKILFETDLELMKDLNTHLKYELKENPNFEIANLHEFAMKVGPEIKLSYDNTKVFLSNILNEPEHTCNLFSESGDKYQVEFVNKFSKFLGAIKIKPESEIIFYSKLINKNDFQYPLLDQIKLEFPKSLENKLSNKQKEHILSSTTNLINTEEYELTPTKKEEIKESYNENLIENVTDSLNKLMIIFPSQREFSEVFSKTQKKERTSIQQKITTLLNGSWLRYVGSQEYIKYNSFDNVNDNRLEFISGFYNLLGVPKNSDLIHLTKMANSKFNYKLNLNLKVDELPTIYNLKNEKYEKENLSSSKQEVLEKIISELLITN